MSLVQSGHGHILNIYMFVQSEEVIHLYMSVVDDDDGVWVSYLATGVVGMFGQFAVEALQENLIRDFAHIHAGFIQHGEDALMLLLHQIHDDLIIEVVDLTAKGHRR